MSIISFLVTFFRLECLKIDSSNYVVVYVKLSFPRLLLSSLFTN